MRNILSAVLAAAALIGFSGLAPAPAAASEQAAPELSRAYPGEAYSQYYRRRYYGGYYRRGYNPGAAAAAGIAGLAAGAIIGGAIANQGAAAQPLPKTQDPDFIAYCSRKYRSFDPIDGTFLARDGLRYECEYP
jgi:BA14K-like protein